MVVACAVTAGVLGYELQSEAGRSAPLRSHARTRARAGEPGSGRRNEPRAGGRVALRASRAEQDARMVMLKQRLPTWASACAALALMAGCATDSPRPVTRRPWTQDRYRRSWRRPSRSRPGTFSEFSGAVVSLLRDADDINAVCLRLLPRRRGRIEAAASPVVSSARLCKCRFP